MIKGRDLNLQTKNKIKTSNKNTIAWDFMCTAAERANAGHKSINKGFVALFSSSNGIVVVEVANLLKNSQINNQTITEDVQVKPTVFH